MKKNTMLLVVGIILVVMAVIMVIMAIVIPTILQGLMDTLLDEAVRSGAPQEDIEMVKGMFDIYFTVVPIVIIVAAIANLAAGIVAILQPNPTLCIVLGAILIVAGANLILAILYLVGAVKLKDERAVHQSAQENFY